MSFIIAVIKLIIVLGIVVTIHELGHFIFAKLFKMRVNEFGIGFGKAIFKKEYKGTVYSLRLIPLGGFVEIEGEDGNSEDENSFVSKHPIKKIIVLVMGATFNALLAIILLIIINLNTSVFTNKIISFSNDSIFVNSEIKSGDIITKIGNKKINIYADIENYKDYTSKDIELEYIRDGENYKTEIKDAVTKRGYVGVFFDTSKINELGQVLSIVELVEPGLPAEIAGIRAKDNIIKIDDNDVEVAEELIDITTESSNKELNFTLIRKDEEVNLKVTPKEIDIINFNITEVEVQDSSLKNAYYMSLATISQVFDSYVDLFKGKVKISQMSGIVGIGEVVSRAETVKEFFSFVAIISLAIGFANLLPFPPLDGGKVLIVCLETVSRKKVTEKINSIISYIGFSLLLILTIYITIKDILRII